MWKIYSLELISTVLLGKHTIDRGRCEGNALIKFTLSGRRSSFASGWVRIPLTWVARAG